MVKEITPEDISDRDVANLEELQMCILRIRNKALFNENKERVYDNKTLDRFIDEFTEMIFDASQKRSIKNYIAHPQTGAQLEISTRVIYD